MINSRMPVATLSGLGGKEEGKEGGRESKGGRGREREGSSVRRLGEHRDLHGQMTLCELSL